VNKNLVLIGIQARSGSTRLPNKAFELISGKTMLDRVIETCKKASSYINNNTGLRTRVVVLTPFKDPIVDEFHDRCEVIEGPEFDVLARYVAAAKTYQAGAVIRVTGDCPLLPSFLISKLITLRDVKEYDYVSNTDPRFRTSLDGADCEAMSARMLEYTGEAAKEPYDREHVTTYMRKHPPIWAKLGCVVNYFDHSDLKLSVDTKEDLERVRHAFGSANEKYQQAILTFGSQAVHRV
jgi:spore coat polysaccharide biosynthesis protein SpsF (cytidylyltransferase family)